MGKKNRSDSRGIVYSTDPSFRPEEEQEEQDACDPKDQRLLVLLDKKQRAGKAVTLVEGFQGSRNDLEELGKRLKNLCGTGGSVKDGVVLIQGDHRSKVHQFLIGKGYLQTRMRS